MGWGLCEVTFKCGAGPRLRICMEGERQHVQRGTSRVWSSEFKDKALDEGVWVGFRPSVVGGLLPVPCVEVGPWVRV